MRWKKISKEKSTREHSKKKSSNWLSMKVKERKVTSKSDLKKKYSSESSFKRRSTGVLDHMKKKSSSGYSLNLNSTGSIRYTVTCRLSMSVLWKTSIDTSSAQRL